jgi:hypothetical protein
VASGGCRVGPGKGGVRGRPSQVEQERRPGAGRVRAMASEADQATHWWWYVMEGGGSRGRAPVRRWRAASAEEAARGRWLGVGGGGGRRWQHEAKRAAAVAD